MKATDVRDSAGQPADKANEILMTDGQDGRAVTIRECVEDAMRRYLSHLEGHDVRDVYQMVLAEVEAPLLEVVMGHTRNNQSRTAEILGLNRGTLRKKLRQYGML